MPGLGGWNCRHSYGPYVEGAGRVWTDEQLKKLDEKCVTYNGKDLTKYEASQQQRYIERQIRRWKREYAAMEAAGQDGTEAAVRLKRWQETEADFLRQTGRRWEPNRAQILAFGRSEAGRASRQNNTAENIANDLFSLGSTEKNVSMYLKEKPVIDRLSTNGIKYIQRISEKEIIVDVGSPIITQMRQHAKDNLETKADRTEMTMEKAQTFVNQAKLVLYQPANETMKFMAADGYAVLNFNHELVTAVPQKWRKKFDRYLEGGEAP